MIWNVVVRDARKWFAVTLIAVGLAMLGTCGTGCKRQGTTRGRGSPSGRWTIAIIPQQTEGTYWQRVEQGARTAAKAFGVALEWRGPHSRTESKAQAVILRQILHTRVDGIGLAPLDRQLLLPLADQAATRMPIVLFAAPIGGTKAACTIVADPRQSGVASAQKMLEMLGGIRARLMTVHSTTEPADPATRARAFARWMTDASMDIVANVTCSQAIRDAKRASVRAELERFVSDGRLQLDGIFAADENAAVELAEALRELRQRRVAAKTLVAAYTETPKLDRFVQERLINIVLTPDPGRMGRLVVENLVHRLQGRPVAKQSDPGLVAWEP